MAKKKAEKITADKTITITPYSKAKSYVFASEGATLSIDGGFTYISKGQIQPINGYFAEYFNFAVRKKNNLILTTLFTKENGKYKKVTTTIKNFFADLNADYKLKYKTFKSGKSTDWSQVITPASSEGIKDFYGGKDIKDTGENNFLLGTSKKDNFIFTNSLGNNFVFDQKGNDSYIVNRSANTDQVVDLAGNDKYSLNRASTMNTYDYAGNDKYTAQADYAKLYTFDAKGNDDYTISNSGSHLQAKDLVGNDKYHLNEGSDFWIDDKKGNDKYWVTSNDSTSVDADKTINDATGKDKYYLTKARLDVVDNGGNDRYEINESKNVTVSDYGKGSDTVIIDKCRSLEYGKFYITNSLGNETYLITDSDYTISSYNTYKEASWDESNPTIKDESGNDKYSIIDSNCMILYDKKGNDKYNVSQTVTANADRLNHIIISDIEGNDKYAVSGLSNDKANLIYIFDGAGNDNYDLKYVYNYNDSYGIDDLGGNDNYKIVGSNGVKIWDDNGKDNYTITDCYKFSVKDVEQNYDSYVITNSSGSINDSGGNDNYQIAKLTPQGENDDEYLRIFDYKTNDATTGDKDTLTIGANKNDLVFMTNFGKQGDDSFYDDCHSLIIYDIANKGFVQIGNYYSSEFIIAGLPKDSDPIYEYGNGRIETIKAGKTVLKNVPETFIRATRSAVQYWLNEEGQSGMDSVIDVLQKGSDEQIHSLINCFENPYDYLYY